MCDTKKPATYPKASPYAWFWKRENRLDGFDF